MTTTLFSCRANAHSYTITEYTEKLEPVAAYEVKLIDMSVTGGPIIASCNCAAEGICQHRRLVPVFLQHGLQSEPWLIAYDRFTGWYEPRQYVGPLKEFVA